MQILQNEHGRFYGKELAPSSTTVLGVINNKGLNDWRGRIGNREADRIMNIAADLGTEVHELTEHVEKGGECRHINQLTVRLAKDYLEWVEEYVESVIGIEVPMMGELNGIKYGGTADRIYKLKNGDIAIIDIKTSKQMSNSMGYQLAALEHLYGQKVRRIIVRVKKQTYGKGVEVKEYTSDKDLEVFGAALQLSNSLR